MHILVCVPFKSDRCSGCSTNNSKCVSHIQRANTSQPHTFVYLSLLQHTMRTDTAHTIMQLIFNTCEITRTEPIAFSLPRPLNHLVNDTSDHFTYSTGLQHFFLLFIYLFLEKYMVHAFIGIIFIIWDVSNICGHAQGIPLSYKIYMKKK